MPQPGAYQHQRRVAVGQFSRTYYPGLNEEGLRRVDEYAALLLKDNRYLKNPGTQRPKRYIPLYDLPVSAGTGMFLDSDNYELIEADDHVPYDATFAVRVCGDSMVLCWFYEKEKSS